MSLSGWHLGVFDASGAYAKSKIHSNINRVGMVTVSTALNFIYLYGASQSYQVFKSSIMYSNMTGGSIVHIKILEIGDNSVD
jgi:hypothetical protein